MSIADRVTEVADFDLTAALTIEQGSFEDYKALSVHHYRAQRPATATRILTLTCHERSIRLRLREMQRLDSSQALAVRDEHQADASSRRCGVLVESMPSLSCLMRDYALSRRYSGIADVRQRVNLLNAEVRCISRVVIHPQWRGLGLAVRLVREALSTATTVYTEALAAMGRVNPFFERAGMTAYQRPTHDYDERLVAAMRHLGFQPSDLSNVARVMSRLQKRDPTTQAWFERELRRWFSRNGGRRGGRDMDVESILLRARERLGLEPVYYLKMKEVAG